MKFSKELYPKIALIKSAFAFTDRAYVHLDADDQYYYVNARAKPGCDAISDGEFMNEMLCQSARHAVYLQTRNLRELLVARAMASTVIQNPDAVDEPNYEQQDEDGIAEGILADWFEAND